MIGRRALEGAAPEKQLKKNDPSEPVWPDGEPPATPPQIDPPIRFPHPEPTDPSK